MAMSYVASKTLKKSSTKRKDKPGKLPKCGPKRNMTRCWVEFCGNEIPNRWNPSLVGTPFKPGRKIHQFGSVPIIRCVSSSRGLKCLRRNRITKRWFSLSPTRYCNKALKRSLPTSRELGFDSRAVLNSSSPIGRVCRKECVGSSGMKVPTECESHIINHMRCNCLACMNFACQWRRALKDEFKQRVRRPLLPRRKPHRWMPILERNTAPERAGEFEKDDKLCNRRFKADSKTPCPSPEVSWWFGNYVPSSDSEDCFSEPMMHNEEPRRRDTFRSQGFPKPTVDKFYPDGFEEVAMDGVNIPSRLLDRNIQLPCDDPTCRDCVSRCASQGLTSTNRTLPKGGRGLAQGLMEDIDASIKPKIKRQQNLKSCKFTDKNKSQQYKNSVKDVAGEPHRLTDQYNCPHDSDLDEYRHSNYSIKENRKHNPLTTPGEAEGRYINDYYQKNYSYKPNHPRVKREKKHNPLIKNRLKKQYPDFQGRHAETYLDNYRKSKNYANSLNPDHFWCKIPREDNNLRVFRSSSQAERFRTDRHFTDQSTPDRYNHSPRECRRDGCSRFDDGGFGEVPDLKGLEMNGTKRLRYSLADHVDHSKFNSDKLCHTVSVKKSVRDGVSYGDDIQLYPLMTKTVTNNTPADFPRCKKYNELEHYSNDKSETYSKNPTNDKFRSRGRTYCHWTHRSPEKCKSGSYHCSSENYDKLDNNRAPATIENPSFLYTGREQSATRDQEPEVYSRSLRRHTFHTVSSSHSPDRYSQQRENIQANTRRQHHVVLLSPNDSCKLKNPRSRGKFRSRSRRQERSIREKSYKLRHMYDKTHSNSSRSPNYPLNSRNYPRTDHLARENCPFGPSERVLSDARPKSEPEWLDKHVSLMTECSQERQNNAKSRMRRIVDKTNALTWSTENIHLDFNDLRERLDQVKDTQQRYIQQVEGAIQKIKDRSKVLDYPLKCCHGKASYLNQSENACCDEQARFRPQSSLEDSTPILTANSRGTEEIAHTDTGIDILLNQKRLRHAVKGSQHRDSRSEDRTKRRERNYPNHILIDTLLSPDQELVCMTRFRHDAK